MSTQHDGTALTKLYAQLRDNYDELLTERDNLQTMADVAFRELDAVRDERDEARAEADRLRDAIEQHRRDILGPNLQGIPCEEDVNLWEATVDAEDGDE